MAVSERNGHSFKGWNGNALQHDEEVLLSWTALEGPRNVAIDEKGLSGKGKLKEVNR